MFVFWNLLFRKSLYKLSCVCLSLEKLVNGKHFSVKGKFGLVSKKVFSWKIWAENTFRKLWKILKCHIICWLYQIWSSIAIYILFWIFIFQFHLLKFNFYINFDPHFYNCYLLFPYHFFIQIFYVSNLVFILLIVTYFIWNNLWNVNYSYFNFFIFFLDLISIILIIIYFIWDNLWNYIFFQFHFHLTF
jgi:hypothetical protein